jgi:hypothetical protein
LTAEHQLVLLNTLRDLRSIPKNRDQELRMRFSQFLNTLSIVSNDAMVLDNSIQQIKNEFHVRQQALQVHNHELLVLIDLAEDLKNDLDRMRFVQDIRLQEILSLKQQLEDRQIVFFDGTLKWKISRVQQKLCMYYSEQSFFLFD